MDRWPSIRDQRLADRLSLNGDQFNQLALKLAARVPPGTFSAEVWERALSYPWQHQSHSFSLLGGRATRVGDGDSPSALLAKDAERIALITFGSLGSAEVLAQRLGSLDDELLLVTGWLANHYVAPSAHLAAYGALPATIVRSAGASVRAGLILLTWQQFELLTRLEFNYRLAALPGEHFRADLAWRTPERVFAYVSRHGAFAPEGTPPPLSAVESRDAPVPAVSQRQVLDAAAELVLGSRQEAEALVRRTIEDYSWSVRIARPLLKNHAALLREDDWELFSTHRAERTE